MYTSRIERTLALAPDPSPHANLTRYKWQAWLDAGTKAAIRMNSCFAKVRSGRL